MRNSINYVTTLDPLSAADMEKLYIIKQTIRAANQYSKFKKRVVLRGRRAVDKNYTNSIRGTSYDRGGNIVGGLRNASRMDVYIYDR